MLANSQEFRAGHWDEPNVLAHLRLSDRTVGGKKTLFIEEIQSDWAQKGRREGFGPKVDPRYAEDLKEYQELYKRAWNQGPIEPAERDRISARMEELDLKYGGDIDSYYVKPNIPTAPIVTDTGKWTALGLKRVLKMAADEGYDAIGLTSGTTHFKRWGSERFDWRKEGKGWAIASTKQSGGEAGGLNIEAEARARNLLNERTDKIQTKDELIKVLFTA